MPEYQNIFTTVQVHGAPDLGVDMPTGAERVFSGKYRRPGQPRTARAFPPEPGSVSRRQLHAQGFDQFQKPLAYGCIANGEKSAV